MLACNVCWCDLDSGSAYISQCDHVFCEKDIHDALQHRQCTVCATKMDERDIRVSEVQPELVVLQRKLAGYSPNDMLTAVAYGIKFWNDQIEIRYGTELEKSFTSAQRNAEMYKRKLQDVHAAYKKAKAKQDELWSQLKDREKDIRELQVRYEEKSREKRSLEDFTARRGSLSEGARTFGARPVQAIPRTVAQIDTRIQTEKESWQPRPIPTTVNGEFRDRRSYEHFYGDVRSRRTSFNRTLDSAITPPTTTQGLRDRRPLSPYTRQPIRTASGERPRLFSQRRIF